MKTFDNQDIARINDLVNFFNHEIEEECKAWFGKENAELIKPMKTTIISRLNKKILDN